MDRERIDRVSRIYDEARLLAPGDRSAFLSDACADDTALRRDVETLLGEDVRHAETIRTGGPAGRGHRVALGPGDAIGPYRIVRRLGEGGMGIVHLAEQERPLRRQVALKVIRRGMDSERIVARFESERQALARMDHPCIARVLDAGTTDDGRPYFVMEYVDGEPITAYCDREGLSPAARLELLAQVCDGVQHAHQKAIIHRDLKPSNVLVATRDGRPVPKIIDFGIAKAIGERLTDHTLVTEQGQIVGTPEYMSPEQAGRATEAVGVDTRTDIYSLGVLLYELLVGALPFERPDQPGAGHAEILRRIREEEPRKPSTRVADARSGPGTDRRGTTGTRRASLLRGDLDWITMKALEKDPARRYASPSEFAADLRRYLVNEPVLAGPPSAAYRVRKFVRRHRVGVGFAAALAVLLLAFAVVAATQARRIARERDRATVEAATADRTVEFLVSLFEESDPARAQGDLPDARELLDRGAARIAELDDQPLVQAKLLETIGYVYTILGLFDEGVPLLERAVAIRERFADADEPALATALHHLANGLDNRGDAERAEALARRAVEIRRRRLGDSRELAHSLNALGNALWHQDRMDEAEEAHRAALAIRERVLAPDDAAIGQSLHNLGAMRYFDDDPRAALELWTRSAAIAEAAHGPDDFGLATSLHTIAIVHHDLEQWDEALAFEERALAIREKVLGPDHVHVALSLTVLGNIHRGMGDAAAGEPLLRRALEIGDRAWGPRHGEVRWMRRSLVRTLLAMGRFEDAEGEAGALLAVIEARDVDDERPGVHALLGDARRGQGRLDEAADAYRRAIEIGTRVFGADDPEVAETRAKLAEVLPELGRPDEANAPAPPAD